MQYLHWTGPFKYPNMVKFSVPSDGSCLFHSLALAYNQVYRLEKEGDQFISRQEFVRKLRNELANLLASPIDPLDSQGKRYYDIISRGTLYELSKTFPEYQLENMQETLRRNEPIDYVYFEFLGDAFDKDIYILDGVKKDVYRTGEEGLYQKGKPSIVLLYTPGHYELIGVIDQTVTTLFSPNSDFIQYIKTRI